VLYTRQNRYADAETLLQKALEGWHAASYGDEHPKTLESTHELGVLYAAQGRHEAAEPLLVRALEGRAKRFGANHPATLDSLGCLVRLYEAWGKTDQALQWRKKLTPKVTPQP